MKLLVWHLFTFLCPLSKVGKSNFFQPSLGLRVVQWYQRAFLSHVLVSNHTISVSHYTHTPIVIKTSHIQHTRAERPFSLNGSSNEKGSISLSESTDLVLGVKGIRHSHEQGACTLTSPSCRVQENNSLSFSSSPGFTELAYVRAEQSGKIQRETPLSPQLLGHH